DVTPLACHGCLQVLGLERNRVSDMKALEILSSLPLLYSLNLSQNPLTESLSKLRDGRGRGVVRQLIPQIRVLDGIHLSSGEGGAVDAQTLDEAVDLICRDTSRARAAWSEEDVTEARVAAAAVAAASTATTIKVVQEDRWRPDGVGKEECLPLAGLDSCFSRSPTKKGVATVAGLGGGGSPIPPQMVPDQGGGMHWDSDLTQGGRQALSGNPSSAIRRHQCRGGAGNGRNEHTPTRVLETLDLAKVMERGLKQRHSTQQSADRVSEWRRETNSDAVPQEEDPSYEPLDGTARPSPLALEALPLSSSAVEGGFDRRAGLVEGGRRDSDILTTKATTTWASLTTSVANPPKSPAAAAAAAAVDDGVRKKLPAGKGGTRASSGRPWTSEGVVGASGRGGGAASATNQRRAPPGQEQHGGAAGDDRGGSGGRRRGGEGEPEARSHRRRRRPQTAKEAPGKRCLNGGRFFDPEQDETFRNYRNACWQPVWESLQTARLISSPRLFQTTNKSIAATNPAAAAGVERSGLRDGPATQAGDGAGRKIGSVDFGRQRRARATVRASRGGDDANYLDLDESDGASSARDEGEGAGSSRGDDSQEADDRNKIKKRASGFCSPASKASGGSGIASRLSTTRSRGVPASCSSPSAVLPAEEKEAAAASAGSTVARERNNEAIPQQPEVKPVEGNSSGRQPPKARRREAASLVSRRSLQVMDDTSSSGGGSDNNS
ncbi:unnamed protein product, partial [Ectocarpus sp. 8 AP-2014]